jgi:hypothetical protein
VHSGVEAPVVAPAGAPAPAATAWAGGCGSLAKPAVLRRHDLGAAPNISAGHGLECPLWCFGGAGLWCFVVVGEVGAWCLVDVVVDVVVDVGA